MQFEEYALKLNAGDFASRTKAKAKPQKRASASSSTRTISIGERTWTDVEPGEKSISDYEVSKKKIRFLRQGNLPREDDGAIEFWRVKDNLQKHFLYCHHCSDDKWKKAWQEVEETRKDTSIVLIHQDKKFLYLRALQSHSGRNPMDPSPQDNVLIPNNVFEYIYHIGSAINLHSITNSGLIPGVQNLSKRQTVFFTSVDPMNKEHRGQGIIDLEAPRLAWYNQKT